MLLNPITLHLPQTPLEAAKLYKELEEFKVLAGGTFLLNTMKLLKTKGTKTARHVLSLAKVKDLKGVSIQGDTVIIKAMTKINELLETPLPEGHLRILHTVCKNISTNPIRNMATVGGNLTCRYTWTEMGAVMIALDAKMHFLGPDGKEEIKTAEEFFKNGARCEKLFTHVSIKTNRQAHCAYRRVKKTIHVDIPLLAICVNTEIKGKKWYNTRIGINNGLSFAQRDFVLEEYLNKSNSSADLGEKALEHLTVAIYDTKASEYKQHMFRVSLKSAINEIAQS